MNTLFPLRGILILLCLLLLLVGVRSWRVEEGRGDERKALPARAIKPEPGPLSILRLAPFDPDRKLAEYVVRKGMPYRFAEAEKVELTPDTHGRWIVRGEQAQWTLRIEAPGARNLNLGFAEFHLPPSASLELQTGGVTRVRPFTARDNDEHGELWTPVVEGEDLELVLRVAVAERARVGLRLCSINRGFREVAFAARRLKVGSSAPEGDCHIDVVCSAEESGVGPLIEAYRKQIKAGGVYTLEGVDTCSGAAVNNTRNDGTPYFLTADHCGVRAGNAASMVVYWNHENSACRDPGTAVNGENGDGPLSDFSSGAIFRATFAEADATLVELDDPLDPTYGVFLAGWSRTGTPELTATVHFPNTSEKRISFDLDAPRSTADSVSSRDANGTHWMVIDWDFGSTELGSSGSPLFDESGRIVGQLTGGDAACGNNSADWYGKFAKAWSGGGTSGSRLRDWLDPDGTDALTLDGIGGSQVRIAIAEGRVAEGSEGTVAMEFEVELSEAATESICLKVSTGNISAEAGADYVALVDEDLAIGPGETRAVILVEIVGDDLPEENETFRIVVTVDGDSPAYLEFREVIGTIMNDDFAAPRIVGPSLFEGAVAEELRVQVESLNTPTAYTLEGAPPGMTIDGGGLIEWIPGLAGSFEVTVTGSNPVGSAEGTIRFTIDPNPLAAALDSPGGLSISTGGEAPFARISDGGAINGGDSVGSGLVEDNEASRLEVTVEGPDYLGFWWKVSSEQGFDFLSVAVDDERRARITGEVDWEYMVLAIPPGRHTVRWLYQKDSSVSSGADRGWLDFVQLASVSRPFLMEAPQIRLHVGEPAEYRIATVGPTAFAMRNLGFGLTLNAEGEIMGVPSGVGSRSFTLLGEADGGSLSVPGRIEVFTELDAGAAVGQAGLIWETSGTGTSRWISQGNVFRDFRAAAQEDGVGDDGQAELSAYVMGPGEVSFDWRVESEENFDFLRFEVDGVQVEAISGVSGWVSRSHELPYGWHKLSWVYSKDDSVSELRDTAWLDRISFKGYARWAMEAGVGRRLNGAFDLDDDGQSQLMEFATGGSATEWDRMPGPLFEDGHLAWSTGKPSDAGVHYDVEVSDNLVDWNREERTVLQDDEILFHARDDLAVGSKRHRFMRLLVHPRK